MVDEDIFAEEEKGEEQEELSSITLKSEDIQANFSALLYLLTEQQALIGLLLQELADSGYLDLAQIARITDRTLYLEGMPRTYMDLYKKFCWYFLRTKELLQGKDVLHRALKDLIEKSKAQDEEKEK